MPVGNDTLRENVALASRGASTMSHRGGSRAECARHELDYRQLVPGVTWIDTLVACASFRRSNVGAQGGETTRAACCSASRRFTSSGLSKRTCGFLLQASSQRAVVASCGFRLCVLRSHLEAIPRKEFAKRPRLGARKSYKRYGPRDLFLSPKYRNDERCNNSSGRRDTRRKATSQATFNCRCLGRDLILT